MADCTHDEAHNATITVNFLKDTGQFFAEIRIECQCGQPFQFLGLPLGVDLNGAAISPDGLELRVAIAPLGSVPQPLDAQRLSQGHGNTQT